MEKTNDEKLTMEEQALEAFEKADICTSPRWTESLTLTKLAEILTNSELYKNMKDLERSVRLMVVGYCIISCYDSAYEKMIMPDFFKGLKLPDGVAIVAKVKRNTEDLKEES